MDLKYIHVFLFLLNCTFVILCGLFLLICVIIKTIKFSVASRGLAAQTSENSELNDWLAAFRTAAGAFRTWILVTAVYIINRSGNYVYHVPYHSAHRVYLCIFHTILAINSVNRLLVTEADCVSFGV
jgi:hypothetical protein